MLFVVVLAIFSFFMFSSAALLMALLDVSDDVQDFVFKRCLPIISFLLAMAFLILKRERVMRMVRELSS
jgi:ABC-type Na+ efflux pump permease subunit